MKDVHVHPDGWLHAQLFLQILVCIFPRPVTLGRQR